MKNITIYNKNHDKLSDNDVSKTKSIGTLQEDGVSDDDYTSHILLHPSDDIDVDDKLGVTFKGQVLMQWKQQQMKLLHDYSHAGYFLTPHPFIFGHSKCNITNKDKLAVE